MTEPYDKVPLVQVQGLSKTFVTGEGQKIEVLQDLDLDLHPGERIAILGESGVGKTTLLQLLGALDHPTGGRVLIDGEDLFARSTDELAAFRNRSLGFVFQFHHLLPEFSALENVMMPGLLRPMPPAEIRDRARAVLCDVGLEERLDHRVGKLSGGERQRVAVARALVLDPLLVLADEPTGNLDPETGARVADALLRLNEERRAALVVVTHSRDLARRLGRAVMLRDGRLAPFALEEPATPRA